MVDEDPATDELEALLRLQGVDTSIRRLEHRLEQLPEQARLDEVVREAASVRAERDARRVDLDLVEAEMRKHEGELELLQQRRGEEQQRMYAGEIHNPRELQALRAEIENIGERIGRREDELLEVMERREELAGEVEGLDARGEELASREAELTVERDEAAKEVLAELAELKVSRDEERGRISDDLLERYETSKEKHGGVGVGAMEHRICTACRMELTPLEVSDLRDAAPIASCPQCQRLLVVLE